MRFRLSAMMGLVYAVQGAFWPVLAVHLHDLGIEGRERGWIFATLALGSLAMPLGAGHLVDRRFASQKALAVIFAVATAFLVVFASGWVTSWRSLFALFLAFWMVAAPAFALCNAIALRHLDRPYEQFSGVRLWGTFGWMAVGWVVTVVMALAGSHQAGHGAYAAFWVSAAFSALLAGYSLTLPDTPPLARRGNHGDQTEPESAWIEAFRFLRRPGLLLFLITAFGVHLTTPFVFQVMPTYFEAKGLPRAWISSALTLGQWPEIGMLAVLPWIFRRFGVKTTLALGIGAWVVRFGSLALDPPLWLAIAGIPLHGVAIACFTVSGQMFIDSQAPAELRASAQALYLVLTTGLGSLGGSLLAGSVVGHHAGDYARVFLVPCGIDVALLIYFCAGFRPPARIEPRVAPSFSARGKRPESVLGVSPLVGNLVTESADG